MIITVTLNPAIDETVEVEQFAEADTNRVVCIRRDIGGKGINVSRVLRELGYEPLATGFAPGQFGRMIEDQLVDGGIGCDFVTYPGETRTNINVIDRATRRNTLLAAAGPAVPASAVRQLRARLWRRLRADSWLVLAGSIPPPLTPEFHVDLIRLVQQRGGAAVLDADGPVVAHVLAAQALPMLLKMNDHELGRLLHMPADTEGAVLNGARSLQRQGIESVVVTRGGKNAIAVTPEGEFRATPPAVNVDSAVGAGDGFLAGLLLGLRQGGGWLPALRLASAAGAGVCMSPGTELCRQRDVLDLLPHAIVEPATERAAAR